MLNGDEATFTVADGAVSIGDATVTLADVPASNGVIHVIDKVLMPPADVLDIPATAASTGAHDSLVAALTQANLVSALQADGPFTVFAPTDAAFAAAGIEPGLLRHRRGERDAGRHPDLPRVLGIGRVLGSYRRAHSDNAERRRGHIHCG